MANNSNRLWESKNTLWGSPQSSALGWSAFPSPRTRVSTLSGNKQCDPTRFQASFSPALLCQNDRPSWGGADAVFDVLRRYNTTALKHRPHEPTQRSVDGPKGYYRRSKIQKGTCSNSRGLQRCHSSTPWIPSFSERGSLAKIQLGPLSALRSPRGSRLPHFSQTLTPHTIFSSPTPDETSAQSYKRGKNTLVSRFETTSTHQQQLHLRNHQSYTFTSLLLPYTECEREPRNSNCLRGKTRTNAKSLKQKGPPRHSLPCRRQYRRSILSHSALNAPFRQVFHHLRSPSASHLFTSSPTPERLPCARTRTNTLKKDDLKKSLLFEDTVFNSGRIQSLSASSTSTLSSKHDDYPCNSVPPLNFNCFQDQKTRASLLEHQKDAARHGCSPLQLLAASVAGTQRDPFSSTLSTGLRENHPIVSNYCSLTCEIKDVLLTNSRNLPSRCRDNLEVPTLPTHIEPCVSHHSSPLLTPNSSSLSQNPLSTNILSAEVQKKTCGLQNDAVDNLLLLQMSHRQTVDHQPSIHQSGPSVLETLFSLPCIIMDTDVVSWAARPPTDRVYPGLSIEKNNNSPTPFHTEKSDDGTPFRAPFPLTNAAAFFSFLETPSNARAQHSRCDGSLETVCGESTSTTAGTQPGSPPLFPSSAPLFGGEKVSAQDAPFALSTADASSISFGATASAASSSSTSSFRHSEESEEEQKCFLPRTNWAATGPNALVNSCAFWNPGHSSNEFFPERNSAKDATPTEQDLRGGG